MLKFFIELSVMLNYFVIYNYFHNQTKFFSALCLIKFLDYTSANLTVQGKLGTNATNLSLIL